MKREPKNPWGLTPQPENIPNELKTGGWCFWYAVPKKKNPQKMDKVPGNHLSTKDPASWLSYDAALAAYSNGSGANGVGKLVDADEGFVFIDLDNCFEDNELKPDAKQIVDQLDSYTEFSPSAGRLPMLPSRS